MKDRIPVDWNLFLIVAFVIGIMMILLFACKDSAVMTEPIKYPPSSHQAYDYQKNQYLFDTPWYSDGPLEIIAGESWSLWSPQSDSAWRGLSQNFSAGQERLLIFDSLRYQFINDSTIQAFALDNDTVYQTLTYSNDTLTISDGNSVVISQDGIGFTLGQNLIPLGQGSSIPTTGDLSFTDVTKRLNIGASGSRIEIDGDAGSFYFDGQFVGFYDANSYFFDDRVTIGGDFSDQFVVDSQGDSVLITKELSNAVISIKGDTINLYGVAKYNAREIISDPLTNVAFSDTLTFSYNRYLAPYTATDSITFTVDTTGQRYGAWTIAKIDFDTVGYAVIFEAPAFDTIQAYNIVSGRRITGEQVIYFENTPYGVAISMPTYTSEDAYE